MILWSLECKANCLIFLVLKWSFWWLIFEKKPFQFWREIWICVIVILLYVTVITNKGLCFQKWLILKEIGVLKKVFSLQYWTKRGDLLWWTFLQLKRKFLLLSWTFWAFYHDLLNINFSRDVFGSENPKV